MTKSRDKSRDKIRALPGQAAVGKREVLSHLPQKSRDRSCRFGTAEFGCYRVGNGHSRKVDLEVASWKRSARPFVTATKRLATELRLTQGTEHAEAVACGLITLLCDVCSKETPDGNIGRLTNEYIARSIGWDGDPELLIELLEQVNVLRVHLDYRSRGGLLCRLYVNNWSKHCEYHTHRRLIRTQCSFANGDIPRRSFAADARERAYWDAAWGTITE